MSTTEESPRPGARPRRPLSEAKRALLTQRLRPRDTPDPLIPARPPELAGAPPLSFAQERLWFMEQFAPGTAAYTIPVLVRLRGALDAGLLERALAAVLARHESLRTRFPGTDDGRPVVAVDAEVVPVPVARADTAADDDPLAAASALVEELSTRPFDLAAGPLLRALLVRLGPDDHLLGVVLHHVVADGWSIDVLLGDLFTAYAGLRDAGAADLAPLPVQYGDYAVWQRGRQDGRSADLDHWRDRLAGVPPLDLPGDHPRPPRQRFVGDSHAFALDADLGAAVADLGRRHGATLYMTLLAAYWAVLSRWSGQDDFAVGSPIAGRSRPELEGLVGMFANVLALRARLDDDPPFAVLLDRARETALDAFAHQELPFEAIVTDLNVPRDVSRSPVFGVTFALQNYGMHAHVVPGLVVEPVPLRARVTRFDLELYVLSRPEGLRCTFTYDAALFTAPTVARLARHLETLLRAVVADPSTPVSRLRLLDDAEHAQVVGGFNDTAVPRDDRTLADLLAAQAARTPDRTALAWDGGSATYAALARDAQRVARGLRARGVGPDVVVGVCAERSPALVTALLGVLAAGGAYLPLDPSYPAERLALTVSDAAAPVVLATAASASALPADVDATVLLLDDPSWQDGPEGGPVPHPDDAAYVIYTSGSTGRPKGVVTAHRAIVNRLLWMQETYGLGADDVVLQKTPAGFDVSVWEFFWPLCAGARLVLARPDGQRDPAYLRDAIVAHGVTTAHFVPSMLAAFLGGGGAEECRSLRRVVCSGEELPVGVAVEFLRRLPGCALHNLYGPTEAAVDVSAHACTRAGLAGAARVPIGAPVANTRLLVLDAAGAPAPVGVPGELHIAGVQVARGYRNRPGLTAERFVPDPYGTPGTRMYRTGDRARWRPDGTLDFLGRLDAQVKVRGVRIEPGEVEAALRARDGVREAAVVVREDVPGDARLVAYVVPEAGAARAGGDAVGGAAAGAAVDDRAAIDDEAGGRLDVDALRAALRRSLPEHLVPTAVVALDALPVTPNGKLDRRALPAPERRRTGGAPVAPRTPTERAVAAVWAEVLGLGDVGVEDDFFDLGGHSLLATQVVAKLRGAVPAGRQVGVVDLFGNRTVADLAAFVDRPADDGPRRLLHRLTRDAPAVATARTYVCVPYGGGSAVVYQPLADALPAGNALWAVAIPGHDVGLDEDALAFDALARRCADEVLERVEGPLVLYGHCGVGGALIVEVARLLETAGRELEAVYTGAIFPFARPKGLLTRVTAKLERITSNRAYANWLTSMGVDMDELDPAQADRIVANMRNDSLAAEDYFTGLFDAHVARLRAPVIGVVGDRDPATEYYQERFREWHFLTDLAAVVVLDEAGHFFLKYRAEELADIVTRTHPAVRDGRTAPLRADARGRDAAWWLHDRSLAPSVTAGASPPAVDPGPSADDVAADDGAGDGVVRDDVAADHMAGDDVAGDDEAGDDGPAHGRRRGPEPSMRRFLAVATGELVSIVGSTLTEFAIPLWIYLETGSLARLGLFAVLGLVPGLLVSPLAGALVDRLDRRRVMLAGACAAGGAEAVLGVLFWADGLRTWHLYGLIVVLSLALTFQRLAYFSAIPQLVPKRFLGHAAGLTQLATGLATLVVPLVAVGLLAAIGLGGILAFDVASYAVAIGVLLVVRFPDTMGWRPRESLGTEIANGFRYSWGRPGFRGMLVYFALVNLAVSPLMMLVSPLVLSFDDLAAVGRVAVASGVGVLLGGLVMTVWGGPRTRRMAGVLAATAGLAAAGLVTGLRPSAWVVGAGALGMTFALTILNGIYTTIVQVKVPQRFHGRVFALNTMIAWSTLPIGVGVIGPLGARVFEPLLADGGPLASSAGRVFGVGEGRGIGLLYAVLALALAALVAGALRTRVLSRFDVDVPDALPDDLIGAQARADRLARTSAGPAVAPGPAAAAGPAAAGGAVAAPAPAAAPPGAPGPS